MKPYYDEDGITIYHADCSDVMATLAKSDLLLTDPPYGIGLGKLNNQNGNSDYGGHLAKRAYMSYDDTFDNFTARIVPRLNAALAISRRAAVFTGPHIHEQAKPDVIGGVMVSSAAGRTPWGSKNFLPILFYGNPPGAGRHRPTVITTNCETHEASAHPCAKPLKWMLWLVNLGSELGELIFDPFMGSGTTLVAAKRLGRRAIGIEIEEKYCALAVERLRQQTLFEMEPEPEAQAEQVQMFGAEVIR